MKRRYFDASKPPDQSAGIVRASDGIYRTLVGRIVGIDVPCEHCDGERSRDVRHDALRGFVCPPCDSALDEMFDETAAGPRRRSSPSAGATSTTSRRRRAPRHDRDAQEHDHADE